MNGEPPPPSSPAANLAESTAALSSALAQMDAAALMQRPAPGEWSAWDVAYHVAQIEVWYVAKLCEAGATDAAEAMQRFLAVWSAMRGQALALAALVPPEKLDAAGLLTGVPNWTPRQLIERMAAHDGEHAAQVWAARGGDRRGRGQRDVGEEG